MSAERKRHHFIQSLPASKRSTINEHQAQHFMQLIEGLGKQACAHFRVPTVNQLSSEAYLEFFNLEYYKLFVTGAYASGFVIRDASPQNPLESFAENPETAILQVDFATLRQTVHFILRAERWADGLSSPILDSYINGLLPAIAQRLRVDRTPYSKP